MNPAIVTPKDGIGRLPTVIDENPSGVEIRGEYRNLILAGVHVLGGPLRAQSGSKAYMVLLSGAELPYPADLSGLYTELLLAQGISAKYFIPGDVSRRIDISGSAIGELDLTYLGHPRDLDISEANIDVLNFGQDSNRKFRLKAEIVTVREVRGQFPAELYDLDFDERSVVPDNFRRYLEEQRAYLGRRG